MSKLREERETLSIVARIALQRCRRSVLKHLPWLIEILVSTQQTRPDLSMVKSEGLRVWEIKESHNQFISTRSHKVTWRDSQNTEHRTSTHLPLLVNQSELEAWSRKIQTLTNTLVIRDKVIHKWVPEMDQIISWTAFQANRSLFKKFHSMKIFKSLVTIQNSTDTVLSLYMASETPRLTALSQATRIISSHTNVTSSLVVLVAIYQESQMKRLLWKQDHPLLSD